MTVPTGTKWQPSYRASSRRGAVVPLVAIALIVILGLAALSVDAGNMHRERRNTQTAADAAADAAAVELFEAYMENKNPSEQKAREAALTIAAAHGYPADRVTINTPPQSGDFAGRKGFIEVLIYTQPPRFFSTLFGNSALKVESRAVAAGTMIATRASILVLDPKKKNALKLKGKSSSVEVGGDIFVNSKNKKAVEVNKKAQVKAEHVLVSGGLGKTNKKNIDAEVKTGVPPTDDPFSSLPKPSKGPILNAEDYKTKIDGRDVYNLPAGTYQKLKFDKDDVVRMAPGNYYVDGGGFELKGHSTLTASEVMIFNTGKRGFKISTKGDVTITPPRSGDYEGITLFQDSAKKNKVEFARQTHLDISGIIYAPNAEVKFRKSDVDLSGDDDGDWEEEEDDPMEDDFGYPTDTPSISAAIVAKKLSVDKKTHLTVTGANIGAYRPLLGVVE